MKISIAFAVCFFLVLLNGAESRRNRDHERKKDYKLFVFGDSFVDAGNRPPSSDKTVWSREWFPPYGRSDSAHGHRATGRLSDGLVQSDFLARILGGDESPPPYRLRGGDDQQKMDPSGVNFATAGCGAYAASNQAPSLAEQVRQFRSLVRRGGIKDGDLDRSVALVSITGGVDYYGVTQQSTSEEMASQSGRVTGAIADAVERLLDLGVSKVLVNLAPPIGCQPYMTWFTKYGECDAKGSMMADMHNKDLRDKLGDMDDVLLLDITTAFRDLAQPNAAPCCDTDNSLDFCGRDDDSGKPLYTVCANPRSFFYWDSMNPTQAGWRAVMDRLRRPIQDFLGI